MTPTKDCYTFSPGEISYESVGESMTEDYEGELPRPSGIEASDNVCGRVVISWEYPECNGPGGFRIVRDGLEICDVERGVRSYTDTAMSCCSFLVYSVAAFDGTCQSDTVAAKGFAPCEPVPPDAFSATADLCDRVQLTWNAVSTGACNADSLIILRDGAWLASLAPTVSEYDDFTADVCVSHDYCIASKNACGVSALSCAAGRLVAKPEPPMICAASDSNCKRVHVAWQCEEDEACPVEGFNIYRDGSLIATVDDPERRSYDDESVELGAVYAYCVKAFNSCGEDSGRCCDQGSMMVDTIPPACVVSFSRDFTNETGVMLGIAAFDVSGLKGMKICGICGDCEWKDLQGRNCVDTTLYCELSGGDGKKSVYVYFEDECGNRTSCGDTVILDTNPPDLVTINYPLSGKWYSREITQYCGQSVDGLSGIDWDAFEYSYDGDTWVHFDVDSDCCDSCGFECDWCDADDIPNTYESDCKSTLRIRVADMAGNVAFSPIDTICVDSGVQRVENLSCSPHAKPDSCYQERDVEISWNAPYDASGVVGYSYALAPSSPSSPSEVDSTVDLKTEHISFSNLDEDLWYFSIRAIDEIGNCSDTALVRFCIDRTPPVLKVDKSHRLAGKDTCVTLTIEGNESLGNVFVEVNQAGTCEPLQVGMTPVDATRQIWRGRYCVLAGCDGPALISVTGSDIAANIAACSDTFYADTYPPVIRVEIVSAGKFPETRGKLSAGSVVKNIPSGCVEVSIHSDEALRDLPRVSYVVDGANGCHYEDSLIIKHQTETSFTGSFFIESDQCWGNASFRAEGVDLAGNVGGEVAGESVFVVDPVIEPSVGGCAIASDGTAVLVGPGCLSQPCVISISAGDLGSDSLSAAIDALQKRGQVKCICGPDHNSIRVISQHPASGVMTTNAPVRWAAAWLYIPYSKDEQGDVGGAEGVYEGDLRVFKLVRSSDDQQQSWDWRLIDPNDCVVLADSLLVKQRIDGPGTYMLGGYQPVVDLERVVVYPNPFRPSRDGILSIRNIPIDPTANVKIYDVAGEIVRVLKVGSGVQEVSGEGSMEAMWDAKDANGNMVSHGAYIIVIETRRGVRKGKIAVIR